MLHLTSANPKGQSSESPMGGCMRIAANCRTPRQRESLLWSNNVDDALTLVGHTEVLHAKILDIDFQLHDLSSRCSLFNERLDVDQLRSIRRGNVVVHGHQRAVRSADAARCQAKPLKGLRRRHFVNQVTVDIQQRGCSIDIHDMVVPNFVVECSCSKERRTSNGSSGRGKGAADGRRRQ